MINSLYIVSFLEGLVTFISPCLLPMLPVYIGYFTGGGTDRDTRKAVIGALGFILGFTLIFIALGAFAGLLGGLLRRYQWIFNIVTGAIVIMFGLNFIGVLKIGLLNRTRSFGDSPASGFLPSMLFGAVFSISWTPCVGAFLSSALLMASQQGSAYKGILMLLCYSVGLGVPFLLSAVLLERLKTAFSFIKKHYRVINNVSGTFLIVIGVLMMTGTMGWFLSLLTF